MGTAAHFQAVGGRHRNSSGYGINMGAIPPSIARLSHPYQKPQRYLPEQGAPVYTNGFNPNINPARDPIQHHHHPRPQLSLETSFFNPSPDHGGPRETYIMTPQSANTGFFGAQMSPYETSPMQPVPGMSHDNGSSLDLIRGLNLSTPYGSGALGQPAEQDYGNNNNQNQDARGQGYGRHPVMMQQQGVGLGIRQKPSVLYPAPQNVGNAQEDFSNLGESMYDSDVRGPAFGAGSGSGLSSSQVMPAADTFGGCSGSSSMSGSFSLNRSDIESTEMFPLPSSLALPSSRNNSRAPSDGNAPMQIMEMADAQGQGVNPSMLHSYPTTQVYQLKVKEEESAILPPLESGQAISGLDTVQWGEMVG